MGNFAWIKIRTLCIIVSLVIYIIIVIFTVYIFSWLFKKRKLRIDYCGFGPFCSTLTSLLILISLLKVLIFIIH